METAALFFVQESKEFTSCKFCPWTVLHVDKSQLARLLMAYSTPASQKGKESHFPFSFNVRRESGIPLLQD
eukprot:2485938-Ditylum_brightwellii.AAC.1